MIDRFSRLPAILPFAARYNIIREWVITHFNTRTAWRGALLAIGVTIIYWGLIASDRYVSEAHIVVNRTDLSSNGSINFASLITGQGGAHDELLLREYLLSVDMLNKLDAKLHLREHYSDHRYDALTRLWSAKVPQEKFFEYYLSRVSAEYDTTSGILVVQAQAYTPQMAQRIAALMVQEGEHFINDMEHRLAQEQVDFLQKQITLMSERAQDARQAVLAYQNKKGIISPEAAVRTISTIIGRLEGQLSEFKARREAMLAYLSPDAPDIVQINTQIKALENQIVQEQNRLTSPKGKTLNSAAEEFQRLQLAAEFAQEVYKTALATLERGRLEATRTLKKVSIIQAPTMPQYPLMPRRLYNIITFILIVLSLAGIMHLIVAIIRDHKD